jgi:hypothetical protein
VTSLTPDREILQLSLEEGIDMATKTDAALQTGYVNQVLMETERIPYEGVYHKPADMVVEFIELQDGPHIMGARMYNVSGRYIGWWPAYNVPRDVAAVWKSRILDKELRTRKVFENVGDGQDSLEHL